MYIYIRKGECDMLAHHHSQAENIRIALFVFTVPISIAYIILC